MHMKQSGLHDMSGMWTTRKLNQRMNMQCPRALGVMAVATVITWVVAQRAVAQSPPEIDIAATVALTITGKVGEVYAIEYTEDLAHLDSDWYCLEFLQLPATPHARFDPGATSVKERFYRAVAVEAPTNFVFIPPGTFRMGSPPDEPERWDREGPQTAVTISKGFWMSMYEVTQGQYLQVMGNNPSWFNGDRTSQGGPDYGMDLTRPVENVSWHDAVAYCARLTGSERAAGRLAPNVVYRLPTEAEWEYACRAWTSTVLSYGDDHSYTSLTDYAWYYENSNERVHPVGQKLPNMWGLHDMHGNVWEWCQDWLNNAYAGGIALDPQGPQSGSERVLRGGCFDIWDFWLSRLRSAYRGGWNPSEKNEIAGLRPVIAPAIE